jgi:hypothetical protein
VFAGRKTWSPAHRCWLAGLRFAHPALSLGAENSADVGNENSLAGP